MGERRRKQNDHSPKVASKPVRFPGMRPRWLRVDRLMGELHIPMDSEAGRGELEMHLECRRAAEAGVDWSELRRGWCLGSEVFREELLTKAKEKAHGNHHASTRRETAEEKARRITEEELARVGWTMGSLSQRPKGDPGKVRIARRLRAETSVTLKWIADYLHMGTWTHVANLLHVSKTAAEADNDQLNLV